MLFALEIAKGGRHLPGTGIQMANIMMGVCKGDVLDLLVDQSAGH